MKLSKLTNFVKAHPWAVGAATLGGYFVFRSSPKSSRQGYSVVDGLTVPTPKPKPITHGPDPDSVPVVESSKVAGKGSGTEIDPLYWVHLNTWRNGEAKVTRRLPGDFLTPGEVHVWVLGSVPVVQDRIILGIEGDNPTPYGYCDGPGDVRPIVNKLVSVAAATLEKGVSAAAPQYSTIASIVAAIVKKIPNAVAKFKIKQWAEWRSSHPATKAIASHSYNEAMPYIENVQTWRFKGFWNHEATELSLVSHVEPENVEIPWEDDRRNVTGALSGDPPRVVISKSGQVYVTLYKPEVGPPGACEARYDVTAIIVP